MGLRQGCFCKVWKVENKGNWSRCQISVSAKNKKTGQYETNFSANVNFVGKAHSNAPQEGQRIKITDFEVTNVYVKADGTKSYEAHYTVFDYEVVGENNATQQQQSLNIEELENSDRLPF